MKKAFLILVMPLTITLMLAGCGMSEEDRAKLEERQKKHADSVVETIKSVMSTRDSIRQKSTNDSLLIKTGPSEEKDKNK